MQNNLKTNNTIPSPDDNRDWIAESIFQSNFKLPKSLDYRGSLTTIRNQGSQGSCAAQTAACMKEWQERQDIGYINHMSPQFVYNNRENQASEGMYARDVMKILSIKGCCTELDYPYGKIEDPKEINDGTIKKAKNFKIKSYAKITTINGLKKALLINGPCYIAFPVFNNSMRMWIPKQGEKRDGGHAMTVVGYNNKGFIIRNSWGRSWGDNGYCTYTYDDWGSHWEVWTTIDDTSYEIPNPPIKKCFCF
ncbi:Papain family cysteine protease [seawater metagenome]|uniref:Papain family cysteine protease n=1 Tax=seawater metagenome TaxID=1561972 RepID=A0A5E8CK85_9ZZZZ